MLMENCSVLLEWSVRKAISREKHCVFCKEMGLTIQYCGLEHNNYVERTYSVNKLGSLLMYRHENWEEDYAFRI